ncbi:MAG: DUF1573 domain-containing protein [bacterium]|nr:DUF1573 domain-containing protein [bacterium]
MIGKEAKILLIGGLVSLIVIVVAAFFVTKTGSEATPTSEVLGIEASPASYDLGNVPINGGIVAKEFEIKNITDKMLRLKKIATSCMCTTASVQVGDKTTNFFSMEMAGDRNPPVNLEIAQGQTAKVVVNFDPAAHGPTGTGPFARSIWLNFSDPVGVKELTFNGNVVSQ